MLQPLPFAFALAVRFADAFPLKMPLSRRHISFYWYPPVGGTDSGAAGVGSGVNGAEAPPGSALLGPGETRLSVLSWNILAPCWASPTWYPGVAPGDAGDKPAAGRRGTYDCHGHAQ